MKNSEDRLYELLPEVYRLRDAERGEPLRALLAVITEQVNLVEADIAQTYDNWFIETCEDWVVRYIGDLLGYKILHTSGEPTETTTPGAKTRGRILIPRRDVANVISYRRRKGIHSLLELLAHDAASYPATRAVEFYKLLGWTQAFNFPRPTRGRTVNLRDGDALDLIDSPFDKSARTVDLRRASSGRAQGRYNIPGIGVFVWRLKSYSVTETPAYCLEEEAPECYTFSVLGSDTPLYNRPQPETEPTHIAEELNLPTPIRRRAFEKRIFKDGKLIGTEASEKYYDESLSVFLLDRSGKIKQISREKIIPSNLSDWAKYRPPRNFVAVDPKLGRIVFPPDQKPRYGIVVSYQYAFSADIGGGEYNRPLSQPKNAAIYRVGRNETHKTINSALAAWENKEIKPRSAVIEIQDSGVYTEPLKIELKAGEYLQIRAANRRRPVIRLLDYQANLSDSLTVKGAKSSLFALDGLLITGRSVQIVGPDSESNEDSEYDSEAIEAKDETAQAGNEETSETGDLCQVEIRHCTLVPGWSLHCDCEPQRPNEPSLELEFTGTRVEIEHSIIGTIEVTANERASEPQIIRISDSILDATGEERTALGTNEGGLAYVKLTMARTTVIGKIRAHAIALAENSIFKGLVTVGRRQQGCVRFCYVTPGSRAPRRFRCQPDLAEQAIEAEMRATARKTQQPEPTQIEIAAAKTREQTRVEPDFNSVRYGAPTYCQLAQTCADEILRGADDESEFGAFHDLYHPQRALNLRSRIDEYTPAEAEVGIFYAS
ncbi:MAG TPA: hypothetical protein VK892_07990 [Pyrinomonadaceae bacterium]|nr:hypothetical protein [Pyrinomonadaceae bacterium]